MIGVALADLHLGFRSFTKEVGGRNLREQDVEKAWEEAVERVIHANPDLVTIAGDIFHHPRVSTYAVRSFVNGLLRLSNETTAEIVVAQGNHDAGRTSDVLTPLVMGEHLDRVHIVTTPERLEFGMHGEMVSVTVFPFVAREGGDNYRLEPDPSADVNVLVMHAAVKGAAEGDTLPYFYGSGQSLDVGREADRWDVVACGDYHEFTRLHPTRLAFYSGSLERTSSNIWQEKAPKGFVAYDTATGDMELVPVGNRNMIDLEFDGHPVTVASTLNEELNRLVDDPDALAGFIVRLKVDDFPRSDREHIDWGAVRTLKERCAHFYLDIRYGKRGPGDLGDRRAREGALSLAEEATRFLADDDEAVRALVLHYLDATADAEDIEDGTEEEAA